MGITVENGGILTRGEWPRPWVDEALKKVGFEFVD